ncbi:PREDICTED: apolipoprotein A-IV [Miniopterus natalensis]|uniref:apolipoprotein A-IV n=1 Tax=Miniopterus natalensis TaxID=291302 RepID=UPI0007A6E83B|nr:PREDICTED: apolipoprotein A-IV [Miniopterus natalensis]
MFLKAAVVILALVAVTGTRAEVNADQVATVVWDYFSQLSSNAKEAVEHLQKSELTQQLNSLFQDKVSEGSAYADDLQKKLVPFATSVHQRLIEDSEKVKEQVQKELEGLRAKLQPHAEQVSQKIGDNVRELQQSLQPYADQLRTQVNTRAEQLRSRLSPLAQRMQSALRENADNLQGSLEPFAEELKATINQNVEELKGHLTPFADGLKAKIDQNVEELRRSLAPYAPGAEGELGRQLESLAFQMKKNAEKLKSELSANAEELRRKLFRSSAEPFGEAFNKALVKQVADLKQKLGPHSGDAEGHLVFLEKDLRDKVNSFFSALKEQESQGRSPALPEQAGPQAGDQEGQQAQASLES